MHCNFPPEILFSRWTKNSALMREPYGAVLTDGGDPSYTPYAGLRYRPADCRNNCRLGGGLQSPSRLAHYVERRQGLGPDLHIAKLLSRCVGCRQINDGSGFKPRRQIERKPALKAAFPEFE